jgi:hypothetical protein
VCAILRIPTVYKVASAELVALMLSRGANPNVRFHSKTASEWARENGDDTLAILVERVRLFGVLCSPRAITRLCARANSSAGIQHLPSELMMKLSKMLFPPLVQVNRVT